MNKGAQTRSIRPMCLWAGYILILPALVHGNEVIKTAETAMSEGNYAHAYCALKPLADAGHAQGSYLLGWMYHNGYGVAIDDTVAEQWWSKAAAQGHADALFALGQLYDLEGRNDARQLKALDHYLQAARRGHVDARQILLAKLAHSSRDTREKIREMLLQEPESFGTPAQITADAVNLRSGPGTQYNVIGALKRAQRLIVIEQTGDWLHVGVIGNSKVGWVHGSLVLVDPGPG